MTEDLGLGSRVLLLGFREYAPALVPSFDVVRDDHERLYEPRLSFA